MDGSGACAYEMQFDKITDFFSSGCLSWLDRAKAYHAVTLCISTSIAFSTMGFVYVAFFQPTWSVSLLSRLCGHPHSLMYFTAAVFVLQYIIGLQAVRSAWDVNDDDAVKTLIHQLSPEDHIAFKRFTNSLRLFVLIVPFVMPAVMSLGLSTKAQSFDGPMMYAILLIMSNVFWWLVGISCYTMVLFIWRLSDVAVMKHLNELEATLQQPDQIKVGYWPRITGKYIELDKQIDNAWARVATLFACTTGSLAVWISYFSVLGLFSYLGSDFRTSAVVFIIAALCACMLLGMFVPLAAVTDKCQTMLFQKQSIRKAIGKFAMFPMSTDVRTEHLSHMYYVDRAPMGVEIPIVGSVTYAFLTGKAVTLATFIPVVISLASGVFAKY